MSSFVSLSQYLEEEEQGLPCCAPPMYRKMMVTVNEANDETDSTCSETVASELTMESERPYIRFEPHAILTAEENAILLKFSEQLNRLSQNDMMSIVEELTQCTEVKRAIKETEEKERIAAQEQEIEEEAIRILEAEEAKQESSDNNGQEEEEDEQVDGKAAPTPKNRRLSRLELFVEARFSLFAKNIDFLSREASKLTNK